MSSSSVKLMSASGSTGYEATDVFQIVSYTGTGSTRSVTTGLDLSGSNEGLVWIKDVSRSDRAHVLYNTVKGGTNFLNTSGGGALNATDAYNIGTGTSEVDFTSTGFDLDSDTGYAVTNYYTTSGYISYSFKKAAGFFDVVQYTGDTNSVQTVSHSLGGVPKLMIVKDGTNSGDSWFVYHYALGNTGYALLDSSAAYSISSTPWNSTTPTSSSFTVGGINNTSGAVYQALLFGDVEGVSKVGYFLTVGGTVNIDCGFVPRFILIKNGTNTSNWHIYDSSRGYSSSNDYALYTNSPTIPVDTGATIAAYGSTGFSVSNTAANLNPNTGDYTIYLAIA